MRKILVLVCVLGIPLLSPAHTNKASWANLNTLHVGQKIQVVELNSKMHSGTFVSVSDTAISCNEATGEQAIQRQDVRSVILLKNKHRLRNTFIGAGVGLGAGAGIGVVVNHESRDPNFLPEAAPAILGVIGLVAGAVIGALLPNHDTLYSANSH